MTRTLLLCLAMRLVDCSSGPPVRPLEGDAGHRGGPPVPELDAGTPLSLADAGAVAAPDAGAPSGAVVRVHLRATEEPIEHEAGTAGQMPRAWVSGIRSLHLLRSRDDTAPALVFSHGDGYVEASYADGADTVVGTVPIASLTPGRFSYARVVHTHTRFTIDATMHAGYGPMPGTFEDLIVFSDRTSIGGVAHDHGHYEFVFETGGLRFPTQGEGLALPPLSSGGFEVSLEDGELVYTFPIDLTVTDALTADVDFVFEVNVHEAFRWIDASERDYRSGVFDVTPLGYETIRQAGASSYRSYLE